MRNKFAERLKELRIEAGLTQGQLSKAVNNQVTASAIGLWELNKRVPNIESAIILADYFGVSVDYIVGIED